eukprot:TRINITY_DN10577_c0_g1_i1.p1 TRINITY_DN10577_c0_g1~~TRINITY_DN10577_c0_g1_i1.p1  ORF type:complete len:382 (+),score=20.46 TRINITY_DN10577_c0_g1_i1:62-1207(+)
MECNYTIDEIHSFYLDDDVLNAYNITKSSSSLEYGALYSLRVADWLHLIHWVGAVEGFISLVSSIVVISIWLNKERIRKAEHWLRFVGILAIWDTIMELGVGVEHMYSLGTCSDWRWTNPSLCMYFAVLFYLGLISIWIWTSCIAVNLIFIVFQPFRQKPKIPIRIYVVITVTISLTLTIILGLVDGFGVTRTGDMEWCLIPNENAVMYVIFGFVPVFICWITIFGIYAVVACKLYFSFFKKKDTPESNKEGFISVIQKSVIYPTIFFLVWLPGMVFSLWFYFGYPNRQMIFVLNVGTNMSGFFNVLVYLVLSRMISKQHSSTSAGKSPTNNNNDSSDDSELSMKDARNERKCGSEERSSNKVTTGTVETNSVDITTPETG